MDEIYPETTTRNGRMMAVMLMQEAVERQNGTHGWSLCYFISTYEQTSLHVGGFIDALLLAISQDAFIPSFHSSSRLYVVLATGYTALDPPSTTTLLPVTNELNPLAKNPTTLATSCGTPNRFNP